MVSGAVNTTAHTIKPALQFVKTKPGFKTVSSVFFMLLDDRVLVYGDCAIVPNPNPELVGLYDTIFTTNSKGIGYNVSPIEILPYKDIN
jgi:phosphate acetyltransferase